MSLRAFASRVRAEIQLGEGWVALLALCALLLLSPALPAQQTLWVGKRPAWLASDKALADGPVHPSLVAALAAAVDGDTVVLLDGDHKGELVVSASIRLLGYGRTDRPRLLSPLRVTADGVLLDRLQLSSGVGPSLVVEGCSNVTVTRCLVDGVAEGVQLLDSRDCRVASNLFTATNHALWIRGGGGHLIEDNTVVRAAHYALEIEASAPVLLRRNVVRQPGWVGVVVHSGARVQLLDNRVDGGDIGLSLQTDGNLVQGNQVSGAGRGLVLGVSPRGVDTESRLDTRFLDENAERGQVAPTDNLLLDNLFTDNKREGLLLRGAPGNTLSGNRIRGGQHGVVLMAGADDNRVDARDIRDSGRAAVLVLSSRDNWIQGAPSVRLVDAAQNSLEQCPQVSRVGAGGDVPAPVLAPLSGERLLLFGDLHTHSTLSDGATPPEEVMAYARDVLGLSFNALSDHGEVLSRAADRWPHLNRVASEASVPGAFLGVAGYEVTYPVFWDGHYNVYFPHFNGDLHRAPYDEYTMLSDVSTFSPDRLLQVLRSEDNGALVVRHHYGPTPDYWEDAPEDGELCPLTEICSIHGVFSGDRQLDANRNDRRYETLGHAGTVGRGLAAGRVFGIVGSSDNHSGFPGDRGLVAVLADGVDHESLFEAMRARRTYGTTGAPIVLGFAVNGAPMGSVLSVAASARIEASVTGTAPLRQVVLLRDEQELPQALLGMELQGNRASLSFTDDLPPAPGRSYRLRVEQQDGEVAWSSPIWFDPPPPVRSDEARRLDKQRMSLLVYAASVRAWHKLGLGVLDGLSPAEAVNDPVQRERLLELWPQWVQSAELLNRTGEELGLTSREQAAEIVARWHLRWGGQLPGTITKVNPLVDLQAMADTLGLPLP